MHAVFLPALFAMGGQAWAQAYPTDPGDLTITEFMAEPQVVPDYYGEWFEIYNASGRNMDINGLHIEGDSDDAGFSISSSVVMASGTYLVLGVSSDTSLNGNVDVDWVYAHASFGFERTSDTIKLVYGSVTLDQVTWDSAEWDVQKTAAHQASLNSYDLEWANDLPQNWCPSDVFISSGLYGTPGAANLYCDGSNNDSDGDGYTEAAGDCDDLDDYVNGDAIDGIESPYGVANDDADCDGVRDDGGTDDDGDGYSEIDGDCNDENTAYNPGAPEIVDGADNDCNGCIDDLDNDDDGWTECTTDRQGNSVPYDCDDTDNLINPDQIEKPYDGVDNDCAGGDECDVDGDTYEAEECPESSLQYPNKDRDCDDTNADVHPNATEGDPDNGGEADAIDNDCNGIVDDPYQDLDGDGFTATDGDCWDDNTDERAKSVHPGAEEVCHDLFDNDCNGLVNDGCTNEAALAAVRGGGLCGVTPGRGAAGGSLALLLFSLLFTGRRRAPGETEARGDSRRIGG